MCCCIMSSFIFCCCCSAFNCACVVDIPCPAGIGPFHAVSGGGPSGARGKVVVPASPSLVDGARVTTHALPSIALLFRFSAHSSAAFAVVNSTAAHPLLFPFFFSVKKWMRFTTPNSPANCSTFRSVVHQVRFATYTDVFFSSSSSSSSVLSSSSFSPPRSCSFVVLPWSSWFWSSSVLPFFPIAKSPSVPVSIASLVVPLLFVVVVFLSSKSSEKSPTSPYKRS
mmetsp:Transcript_1875/g.5682  ORF Transcript_1875/g.5682 Transcript_1875/m.5682 type:complete len:225 (+) Transcript_1875:393-1067(+)